MNWQKNVGKLLAILIAMRMRPYEAGRIAWWMPPLVKRLRSIASGVAIVNKFEWNTQNTNKTQLLASNYGTFWSLVVYENFGTQNKPSTQLIDATSLV